MYEDLFPTVIQAVAGENYTVYAYFSDGSIHLFDVKPLIKLGGIYEALTDEEFFKSSLTVLNDTVAWDLSGEYDSSRCLDIDPFTVYESPAVSDPLESVA